MAREAQADQHIVSDLEAQTQVLNYPLGTWRKLRTFAQQERIQRDGDAAAFTRAGRMPFSLPTGLQCQRLLALLNQALEMGFTL